MSKSNKVVDVASILKKGKKQSAKGGGAKKIGRHKAHCQRYRLLGKREKNKERKQTKHLNQVAKKKIKQQVIK